MSGIIWFKDYRLPYVQHLQLFRNSMATSSPTSLINWKAKHDTREQHIATHMQIAPEQDVDTIALFRDWTKIAHGHHQTCESMAASSIKWKSKHDTHEHHFCHHIFALGTRPSSSRHNRVLKKNAQGHQQTYRSCNHSIVLAKHDHLE